MTACNECNDPVDVVIRSSDGQLHGTHSKNLEMYSGGFPPASLADPDQINTIELTETSEIITLMLGYVHNQRYPESDKIEFEVFKQLAEAVEKYQIYAAMEACRLHMKHAAPLHSLDALAWATRHDYMEIADLAAPQTLGLTLEKVKPVIGPAIVSWISFREPYIQAVQEIPKNLPKFPHHIGTGPCQWTSYSPLPILSILSELADNLQRMLTINIWGKEKVRSASNKCNYCGTSPIDVWLDQLAEKTKSFPTFSAAHHGGNTGA
ncbi:hypothetical protein BDN72DRAFT_960970 [Pluteus cervinus]|uniref:Uncharacterized protein n=1 Tax=Pluteus cervinus TaxID=181527 RepID=A0ACD3APK5_9AGAR|nr:hypothetical protein BDN72DRAFT_960970 [Pluteus cervinus]